MLQLELTNAKAKLNNFNPRAELNGEERRPAGDISLTVNCSADVLAHFAPTLKSFLFNESGPRDLADGTPVRYPELPTLHWDSEMTGAKFLLHYGVGKPIEFADAAVNKFVIEPIDGGSVRLSLRVQVHPDEKQAGKLAGLIQQDVEVSLEPAEMPELGSADAEEGKGGKRGRNGPPKNEAGQTVQ